MRFEVIRITPLLARPTPTAEVLWSLTPGTLLIAIGISGDWTRVTVSAGDDTGDVTGWVLTRDCRWIEGVTISEVTVSANISIGDVRPTSDSRVHTAVLRELATKRRAAVAMSVGATIPLTDDIEHDDVEHDDDFELHGDEAPEDAHRDDDDADEDAQPDDDDADDADDGAVWNDHDDDLEHDSDDVAAESLPDLDRGTRWSRLDESYFRRRDEASVESGDDLHGSRAMRRSESYRIDRYRSSEAAAPTITSDTVDVSVFGPPAVHAGSECLVQVFLHTLEQSAAVAASARETDAASGRRSVKTLATEIARGTRVQAIFEGRGLSADEAMQELTWRGEPDACQFVVATPADAAGKTFYPRVLILLNSVPIGTVTFALPATAETQPAETAVIHGDVARRYSYAFLSYASPDRAEVLKRAQGLKAGRIDFFQDLLSLEPGDHWAERLYQEIDRCDLFLLFWSSHAKASPWVMKEVEYALARQKSSSGGLPDITPVIIEGPPPPSPPDTLKDIHFNDSLIYVLAAAQAQGQSPAPK